MTNRRVRRIFCMVLVLCVLISIVSAGASAASEILSGYCGGEGDGTNLSWTLTPDGVLTISGMGAMKDYSMYNNVIGARFSYRDVRTIIINSGVSNIGNAAFFGCRDLTSVSIPDSVTAIGAQAFGSCHSIEIIELPDSVTDIGSGAFYGCQSLKKINVPDGVKSIDLAFAHCKSLKTVDLPDSVVSVAGAFQCSGIESMKIPDGITVVGNYAFHACQNLTNIYIPAGVTKLEFDALGYCYNLTTVYIPTSLTSANAFRGTEGITDVFYEGSEAEWKASGMHKVSALQNAKIHFNSYPNGDTTPDEAPDTGLQLVSATPADNGKAEVEDTKLFLTFSKNINKNLNWSAGGIKIKDYDTKATVLEITNKDFYALSGRVSGDTISIPYALESLGPGHYYITIDEDLVWAAEKNADGSISKFAGLDDEDCHEFVIPETRVKINFRGTDMYVSWDWDYFSGDATKAGYQEDLAVAALALSGAAENDSPKNVEAMLSVLGFSKPSSVNYGTDFNVYNPAVTFASTTRKINGEDKTVVAAVVRGSTSTADWVTDFLATGDGFAIPGVNTNLLLLEYIDTYYPDIAAEDLILLITGHSYGAAVAGTLPVVIDYAYRENTFVYTFASPNHYTADRSSDDFTNVFNIIHSNDGITNVPLEEDWSKVGINLYYTYDGLDSTEKSRFDAVYEKLNGKEYTGKGLGERHVSQTYMAFLLSQLPEEEIATYFTLASVHCPVDVEVYDEMGTRIAAVIDNEVIYYTEPELIIAVDGDEKYIYMPDDRDFRIELVGTASGTMDYLVKNVSADTGVAAVEKRFSDVSLYFGKTMTSEVSGGGIAADVNLSVTDKDGNITSELAGTVKSSTPFKDIYSGAYYYNAVLWANINGITTGTSATTFSPNDTVTRGQAVTFLWRAMGEPTPETTENPFTDVRESDYFYEAVLWAVEEGITLGTSATTFSPKNTCSTAHMVTFIYRTLGIGTDGWYKDAAVWAEREGLLAGTGADVVPGENCPRANVVTFLYRKLA